LKEIKIQIRAGGKVDDPAYFFRNMPEVLANFKFVVSKNPDFVIFFSKTDSPREKCIRISYAREYMQTKMSTCEWALGWQYPDTIKSPNYLRFPNYTFNGAGTDLIKDPTYSPEKILSQKTKFCAFIYWHSVPHRNIFFDKLSKYKFVHSPGPCCTNTDPIGGHKTAMDSRLSANFYIDKVEYLKQFKFTISFENRFAVGYTSEKIYNPMQANSIPIYWGNPQVYKDFNMNSFVNVVGKDFKSDDYMYDYLIEKVVSLDRDDKAYCNMLRQPWYLSNRCTQYTDPKFIFNFFYRLFNSIVRR
jgi:hypothetical protein